MNPRILLGIMLKRGTLRSKYMAQMPKGRLAKGQYKPICRDCAMYSSSTVTNPNIFLNYRELFQTRAPNDHSFDAPKNMHVKLYYLGMKTQMLLGVATEN